MLKIRNIHKILGTQLFIKWLPKTKYWVVDHISENDNTYVFTCFNDNNGSPLEMIIQLERELKYNPESFEAGYELWAWSKDLSAPKIKYLTRADLKTPIELTLWLGYIVEKVMGNL